MAGENPRYPDPDDWWATPARGTERRVEQPLRTPDTDEAGPGAYRVRLPMPLTPQARLYGGIAIAAVVLILLGLFAAGAFTGGGSKAPPTTTTHRLTTGGARTTPRTTPSTPTVPVPSATLKPGDTGNQVKLLQRALIQLGYKPGTVDGDYGPATVTAVKSFQQAEGLTPDGVVGPKTLAALRSKLGA